MPSQIDWYIPGQVLYASSWGEVTIEQLIEHIATNQRLVREGTHSLVHTISNVTHLTKYPPIYESVKVFNQFRHSAPPNTGWALTVGFKDPVVKFATTVIQQLFGVRLRSFDTVDEAVDFIKTVDRELDWTQADNTLFSTIKSVD
jgi:hypothetical protein